MANKNQEVATVEEQDTDMMVFGDNDGVVANYQEDAGAGNENVGQGDLSTPRIVLLQGLSDVVTDQSLAGAAPGLYHNTITDELFKEKYLIPIEYKKEYSVFRKRGQGGGKGGFKGSFATEEEANAHAETLKDGPNAYDVSETACQIFLTLDVKEDGSWEIETPVMMHFSSTALSTSKNLNSAIQMTLGSDKPRFAGVWKLSVTTKSNNDGKWFAPAFAFAGKVGAKKYTEVRDLYYKITGKVDPKTINTETGEIAA
ncbi:hypothetical protein [Endozoicomonas ascidiicola]|uniref:hypothetical protein n=1 Tax=Endozoicomonas ascidiicola TaxID=1698521 RepID=UPI000830A1B8|nr:hypothetical protein [Endozoicomonas ascidiicola]